MLAYRFQIPDLKRPIDGGPAWKPGGALTDFIPPPLTDADVIGRRIDGVSLNIGTYGMGGAGFFGLRLGHAWLVVAVHGAGAWMAAEGRMIEDMFWRERGRAKPWMLEGEGDGLSPRIAGQAVAGVYIERDAMRLVLDDGFALSIDSAPSARPAFEGDGSPRAFGVDDDLRRAVFFSPTDELWI